MKQVLNLFKLRIGVAIALAAAAGLAVERGISPGAGTSFALAMVFLVSFVLYYFVNWKYLSTVWPLK